jgi:hypothetical protein
MNGIKRQALQRKALVCVLGHQIGVPLNLSARSTVQVTISTMMKGRKLILPVLVWGMQTGQLRQRSPVPWTVRMITSMMWKMLPPIQMSPVNALVTRIGAQRHSNVRLTAKMIRSMSKEEITLIYLANVLVMGSGMLAQSSVSSTANRIPSSTPKDHTRQSYASAREVPTGTALKSSAC